MLAAIQSAGDATPLVRVPWNDPAQIMRALDAGAMGIICPMINTKAEAEALVRKDGNPKDKLQAVKVNGKEPTFENIADGTYDIARPLFFYIKNAHRKVIPGLDDFVVEYTSDAAMGPDGYLHERGLVVLTPELLKEMQDRAKNGAKMSAPTS